MAKEAPAGQLAYVWDNNSKHIKINCETEKAKGNKSKLHTILYIVDKIMHICNNHFPRGKQYRHPQLRLVEVKDTKPAAVS